MDSFNIFLEAMRFSDSCIDDVKYLLQGDQEVDGLVHIHDQNNRTLLHHASEIGRFDYAQLLISNKSDVNAQDDTLVTPLHLAAGGGHTEIVKLLIQNGAQVNAIDSEGHTPLHKVSVPFEHSLLGHPETMAELLLNGANFDEHIDLNTNSWHVGRKTPLDWILAKSENSDICWDLVAKLLANGAKFNFSLLPDQRAYLKPTEQWLLLKDMDLFSCPRRNDVRPLLRQTFRGSEKNVTCLLELGANVKATDQLGNTALHIAASSGYVSIASTLLEHGAVVNVCNQQNKTPLELAVQKGYVNTAKVLLDHGASATCVTKYLHLFSQLNVGYEQEFIKRLIENGADICAQDVNRNTVLHLALSKRWLGLARYLIDKGVDINARNVLDESPLSIAVKKGLPEIAIWMLDKGGVSSENDILNFLKKMEFHTENEIIVKVVKKLIYNGTDVQTTDQEGNSALHIASYLGFLNVVIVLLNRGCSVNTKNDSNETPLTRAIQQGHLTVITNLLEYGSDAISVNIMKFLRDNKRKNQQEVATVVSKLIDCGANVDEKDVGGDTALHFAALMDNKPMAETLIHYGAAINVTNIASLTPFDLAVRNGHFLIVSKLIDSGAKGNAVDIVKFLKTYKCGDEQELAKITTSLICHGADILAQDHNGNNALHIASLMKYYFIVDILIKNGALVNVTNHQGETPLHLASSMGHFKLTKMLVENGCDIDPVNLENDTPLNLAFAKGYQKIVDLLLEKGATANVPNLIRAVPKKENDSCSVCYEPKNGIFAFQPCRHANACEQCCKKITSSEDRDQRKCPICRSFVTEFQRIYV